jgi:hypothetical protein
VIEAYNKIHPANYPAVTYVMIFITYVPAASIFGKIGHSLPNKSTYFCFQLFFKIQQTKMKATKNIFYLLAGVFFLAISTPVSGAKVASYPLPPCYTESDNFQVSVSGVKVPVSKTWGVYEYAHYSFEGRTTITITARQDITTFNISPLAYNIHGMANGRPLTLELDRSRYLARRSVDATPSGGKSR